MSHRVDTAKGSMEIEVLSCAVHSSGEFAGNLDVEVRASDEGACLDHLRMRLPGTSELIDVLGSGSDPAAGTVSLVYHTPALEQASLPETIEALWVRNGETSLGSVQCEAAKVPEEGAHQPAGCGAGVLAVILLGAVLLARMS